MLLRIFWVENILYARAFLIPFKRESWNWTLRKITSCTCRIKLFMCISFKTRDCTERILMNRNYQTQIIYALNNISKHQPLPFGRQTIITIQEVSENLFLSCLYGLSRMRHGWYQKIALNIYPKRLIYISKSLRHPKIHFLLRNGKRRKTVLVKICIL